MHSVQLRKTLFTICSSSLKAVDISRRELFLSYSRVYSCTLNHVTSKPELRFVFCGRSCDNFVVLRADVIETLVAWASSITDFLGEVSSLAWIASNFSSASTVRFLSGLLYSSGPVVFSLLTNFVYFEVVVLETRTEIFCWHFISEIQLL
jgi:hypothetical protein